MRFLMTASLLSLALAAPVLAQTGHPMTPAQAIAAASGPGEVEGVFEMQVVSTGASGFSVYLNSEADYRSPANLSIELQPGASAELRTRLGGEPQDTLAGKRLRVKGTARRVPIPRRDGTTYHQTRIEVDRASQLETSTEARAKAAT